MKTYESVVDCRMSELLNAIEEVFERGRYPAILSGSRNLEIEGRRAAFRVYQRFDYPSEEQDVVTLFLAEEGERTLLVTLSGNGGRSDCFRRDSHLQNQPPGYFPALLTDLLAKYQLLSVV